ncbi:GmrSD restriction endonuclease domain-containing protein [Myroides sp.]|uniref:GmrSD restriction endonuclease domain-containing protein n=1 Tax=Myroides sp. TaxID=1874736 RepID=UPI003F3A25EC
MEKPDYYNVFDIHKNINIVRLPPIQRGFVWKTDQMCYLWDSLLRGYPIGSFLASKNEDIVELLDGQQRMTTILAGFYNPFNDKNKKILSLSKTPVLWIDLQPTNKPNDNVYSILICNISHPWGYKANNPGERISTSKIREFLERFEIDSNDYYQLPATKYFPIEANYPIPLSFLLESYSSLETNQERIDYLKSLLLHLEYTQINYNEIIDFDLILDKFMDACSLIKNVFIPQLHIDLQKVKLTDEETIDEDSRDPTLFVRLNQNGTTIDGDELIYSYYKSFFPKAKVLIESFSNGFIYPKMVLNVFSRLAYYLTDTENALYRNSYTLEGFKNAFTKNADFKSKLIYLLPEEEGHYSAAKRLNEMIDMFKGFESDPFNRIPNSLIKTFFKDANLLYIFLCFIDKVQKNSIEERDKYFKKIVSLFIYVHLFSIKKAKIYKPLYEHLVSKYSGECINTHIDQVFEELQYCYVDEHSDENYESKLFRITNIDKVFNKIIIKKFSIYHVEFFTQLCDEDDKFKKCFYINGEQNDIFIKFIERLKSNREILLLAQRHYINKKFKAFESIDILEDTNRPWDYDHIYPKNWVYTRDGDGRAMNNIHWLVKEWINTNGNYRALDFSTNRSDRDMVSPKKRLENKTDQVDSFVAKNDYYSYWINCDKNHLIKDMKDPNLDYFLNAVLSRTSKIYEELNNTYFKLIP